ncbi:MAG: sugar phosphate isomerase/epimerase family protein [Spirochaetota bacterium]
MSGFTDEAASGIDKQIQACKELGWKWIDLRAVEGENITNVSDEKFDEVCTKLWEAGIGVSSFGSEIANWGRKISEPPDRDYQELKWAVPRMHRLGVKMIRIMSYNAPQGRVGEHPEIEKEIIKRLKEMVRMAEGEGIVCVHENCETWGGQSPEHTRLLLDRIDSTSFKLAFDTGNPFAIPDRSVRGPFPYQDALQFYREVSAHVAHVHIKDGRMEGDNPVYTFPGEGDCRVPEILAEMHENGYQGGFSIEPHIAVVFHDPSIIASEEYRWDTFIEYGRRTERLINQAGYGW